MVQLKKKKSDSVPIQRPDRGYAGVIEKRHAGTELQS